MALILILLSGVGIGVVGRLLLPGRTSSDWLGSIVFGVLGAIVGSALGRLVGIREGEIGDLFAAVSGAALLLIALSAVAERRRWREEKEIR